jgi:gluconolactonase
VYAAPPSIEADIFVTIPEEFHKRGSNRWLDVQLHGAPTPVFLEGPTFDRDGNLWLVDIPWGRLFKVTPDRKVTCEIEYDGQPNGLAFHRDGRLFIADAQNGIMVFDPTTGTIETVLDRVLLQPFRGLNDLTFASNGDLYFTDQGQTGQQDPSGRVFRMRADGKVECLMDNVPSPNGLVLNKAETVLYLAVTRDNAVWRLPLVKDGNAAHVTKVGAFIRLSGGVGPDGLALGEDDSIVICHTGLGSAWLFSPVGEPLLRIRAPHGTHTTNCAFGGVDGKRLFITEGPNVLVADIPVSGKILFSHM